MVGRLHEQMVLDTDDTFHGLGGAPRLARLDRGVDGPGERDDLAARVDVHVERVEAGARQLAFDLRRDPSVLAAPASLVRDVLQALAGLVAKVGRGGAPSLPAP